MKAYYSQTLQKGIELLYFQPFPERYPEGVQLIEQALESGEADAYFFLARCYGWGDGNIPEDERHAYLLFKAGIERGSDLCILGADRLNSLNSEVKKVMSHTLEQAVAAVQSRAEDGDPMSQWLLGSFYFWGDILLSLQKPAQEDFDKTERDNAHKALEWFTAAARLGCIPAFGCVFNSLVHGQNGVAQDIPSALQFAESFHGDKPDLYGYYDAIAAEYAKLGQNSDAIRWYEKGVARHQPACCNHLGLLYLYGNGGLPENNREAFAMFQRAADGGDIQGIYNLGRCYCFGWGTIADHAKALPLFANAAAHGLTEAKRFLASIYYEGRCGVARDDKKAFTYAQEAAAEGDCAAQLLLGKCYLYGRGTRQDFVAARKWLQSSVDVHNADALKCLEELQQHERSGNTAPIFFPLLQLLVD